MSYILVFILITCALRTRSPMATAAHRASISVAPAGAVVPPGSRVTIHCHCQVHCSRLFLYRDGVAIPVQHAEAQGSGATFIIASTGHRGTSTYTCRYLSINQHPRWSDPSRPVHLQVGEAKPDLRPTGPHRAQEPIPPLNPTKETSSSPQTQARSGPRPTGPHRGQESIPPLVQTHSPSPPKEPSSSSQSFTSAAPKRGHQNFTQGNTIRLCLGAGVMLLMSFIVATACNKER
ncbi:platelet glycoprotein VI-like [Alligator mississippiensis]|uniref:Platelet glycoprotein VI-like n=1 Tax=Alligator mississippiensis TaxID=8496 RepID=A0A151NMT5_ALLMI|nr:platelet glycoprotein VI-like [Alligator mississippiensis]